MSQKYQNAQNDLVGVVSALKFQILTTYQNAKADENTKNVIFNQLYVGLQ